MSEAGPQFNISDNVGFFDKLLRVPRLKMAVAEMVEELGGDLPLGRVLVNKDKRKGYLGRFVPAARALEVNLAYSEKLLHGTSDEAHAAGMQAEKWNDIVTLGEEVYHAHQWGEDRELNDEEARQWAIDFAVRWFRGK